MDTEASCSRGWRRLNELKERYKADKPSLGIVRPA